MSNTGYCKKDIGAIISVFKNYCMSNNYIWHHDNISKYEIRQLFTYKYRYAVICFSNANSNNITHVFFTEIGGNTYKKYNIKIDIAKFIRQDNLNNILND
jgi:hypothetical protein